MMQEIFRLGFISNDFSSLIPSLVVNKLPEKKNPDEEDEERPPEDDITQTP